MTDRFLLVVQVMSFVGAAIALLAIWFPPYAPEAGYQFTYPDGVVATPVSAPTPWEPALGDVLSGVMTAIFLLAQGAIIFCLRRIGAFLAEASR